MTKYFSVILPPIADAEVIREPLVDDDLVVGQLRREEAGRRRVDRGDHRVRHRLFAGAQFVDEIGQRVHAGAAPRRRSADRGKRAGAQFEAARRRASRSLEARHPASIAIWLCDAGRREGFVAGCRRARAADSRVPRTRAAAADSRAAAKTREGRHLAGLQAEAAEFRVADDARDLGADRDDLVFLAGERRVLGKEAGLLDAHDDGVAALHAELRGGALIEARARLSAGRAAGAGRQLPEARVDAEHLRLIDARGAVGPRDAAAQEQHRRGVGAEIVGERRAEEMVAADQRDVGLAHAHPAPGA